MDAEDGGWGSRKLILGSVSIVLVFLAWLLTGHWPALQGQYMTLVGGITGLYALFLGGNLTHNFLSSKAETVEAATVAATAAKK